MSEYRLHVAPIGNPQARTTELVRRVEQAGRQRAVMLLLDALADPYPPLRNWAATALSTRMTPPVSEGLAAVVRGEDPSQAFPPGYEVELEGEPSIELRRVAALALRSPEVSAEATSTLVATMRDADAVLRYHCLLALHGGAAGATVRAVTEDALADPDAAVRVVAGQIVAERGWTQLAGAVMAARAGLDGADRLQNSLALAELHVDGAELQGDALREVVEDLIDGLDDEETMAAAAMALGRLASPLAVGPLKRHMRGWFGHPLLKVEAAAALALMGDADGVDYLGKMLHGRRPDTRGYAIRLVGELRLSRYRAELEALVRSEDYHADTAALALADFGDLEARELLEEVARTHVDEDVRDAANEALARMAPPTDGAV